MGVNLLQTTGNERGPVSSRVALLLRSAEGKPLFYDFCFEVTSGSEKATLAIFFGAQYLTIMLRGVGWE